MTPKHDLQDILILDTQTLKPLGVLLIKTLSPRAYMYTEWTAYAIALAASQPSIQDITGLGHSIKPSDQGWSSVHQWEEPPVSTNSHCSIIDASLLH